MKTVKPIGLLLAAAIFATAVTLVAAEDKKPARVPLPAVKVQKGEKCVEPTEIMRRDHMQFILHQRDETMHRGIRTQQHSLKNCVNCHADPATGSVLGQNGFCASCHRYAAVSMDCFSCHTDKAEKEKNALASPLDRLVRSTLPAGGRDHTRGKTP